MSKKILIFSLVYYPEFVGGAEVSVKEITDRVSNVDFDMVTLIGDQNKRQERVGNVNVFRFGFRVNNKKILGKFLFNTQKYFFPFIAFLKGVSLMRVKKYDIVWSLMANYAGFASLFFKLKFPKVKFLLTLQEGDPIDYIKRRVFFVYPLFKKIFTKADFVQAISNYLVNFAHSMGSKNVKVVPNGVDFKNFNQKFSDDQKNNLKKELGIKEDDIVLITTSRLVKKNGVSSVIKALERLPLKYKFLILGTGPLEEELKNLVEKLNLKDRVLFVGFVEHFKIPLYFSASNIFIRTSISEGLGNSFLEAMAFGLPVVGTSVGGISDFLKDNETGIVVLPENIESIKNGILRLEDLSFKNNILDKAKILIFEKYNWEDISKEFENIFLTI